MFHAGFRGGKPGTAKNKNMGVQKTVANLYLDLPLFFEHTPRNCFQPANMKPCLVITLLFCFTQGFAQADSSHYIKVNFLYGSKPHRAHKSTEQKSFGGLHGGHVTIQAGDLDYGFRRTNKNTHIFPNKKRASVFTVRELEGKSRYGEGRKTVTFIIPLSSEQYQSLGQIHQAYCDSTPYDYAFFGMRCAAATQEILGEIGVLNKKKRFFNIVTTFYPKRLRKRIFRLAEAKGFEVIKTEGRPTRKWERD